MLNKGGGVGIGSASIVLVFAVLCLSVFSLITFVVAGNDKALIDAEAKLVTGYYDADALAERVLAYIVETGDIPTEYEGVTEFFSEWDMAQDADVVQYVCPVTDIKSLVVKVAIRWDSYEILSWKMVDTDDWEFDSSMDVWLGDDGGIFSLIFIED